MTNKASSRGDLVPNLDGNSRIYAVFGDPVAQVQTPRLINPLFAAAGCNLFAVPFHVSASRLTATWTALAALPNLAGIGVTVPHKVAALALCDELTETARAVGAVNSIQRKADGRMHGALFDGQGFVDGLGEHRKRLRGARVMMVGAGGAGRAIAHALCSEGLERLDIFDIDEVAVDFTASMVNAAAGRNLAGPGDPSAFDHDVLINASPLGLKGDAAFPVDFAVIRPGCLVADIAALSAETPLLRHARSIGAATSDGNDMLSAQIALIAGFAAGQRAGVALINPVQGDPMLTANG